MTATNTVDTASTTVEATVVDTEAQRDMRECLEGVLDAGALATQALELLSKLYAANGDDARRTIIGNASKAIVNMASALAQTHVLLKADPNGEVAKGMPELARASHLEVIGKTDRTQVLEVARMLARLATRSFEEDLSSYSDAGCFYAGTPLGVDFGLEIGVRTGEGAETQRSGLVVGLRLDHLTGAKPAARLGIPKMHG